MLRRTYRRFSVSAQPAAHEAPHLLLESEERKAFIHPSMLRSFTASFLVGSFSVGVMYWLMSHRVTTEAMHRRRFIQSMGAGDDANGFRDSDPLRPFVSPSCGKYKDLVEKFSVVAAPTADGNSAGGDRRSSEGGAAVPSPLSIQGVVKTSLLHETALDHLKLLWNGSIENVQDAMRSSMQAWVERRERDTLGAVNEMARSVLGEQAVAEKVKQSS